MIKRSRLYKKNREIIIITNRNPNEWAILYRISSIYKTTKTRKSNTQSVLLLSLKKNYRSNMTRLITIISLIHAISYVSANDLILPNTHRLNSDVETLIEKIITDFSKSDSFIVVRCTESDLKNVSYEVSKNLTGNLRILKGKAKFEYSFEAFAKLYFSKAFAIDMIRNSDVVLLIDDLNMDYRFPFVLKDTERLFVAVTSAQSKNIDIKNYPKSVVLNVTDDNVDVSVYDIPEKCANTELIQSSLFNRSTGIIENHEVIINEKRCRKIRVMFIMYSVLYEDPEDQMNRIKSHYLYKILSIVAKQMNKEIRIITVNSKIGLYSFTEEKKVLKHQIFAQFIFNDRHWLAGKMFGIAQQPAEGFLFLGTEDVVWLVINKNPFKYHIVILIKFAALYLLLLTCFLFMKIVTLKITKKKWNYDMTGFFMSCWSILLSVSVPRQPSHGFQRTLFISWTVASSVLTLCHYYSIFIKLTNPSLPKLSTQSDLLKSDIKLYVFSEEYAEIAFSKIDFKPKYESFFGLNGNDEKYNVSFIKYVQNLMEIEDDCAILADRGTLEMAFQKYDTSYYYMKEVIFTYPIHIYSAFLNNLSKTIFEKMNILMNTGIMNMFSNRTNSKINDAEYKIDLQCLSRIYFIMALIYTYSIFIFVLECFAHRNGI